VGEDADTFAERFGAEHVPIGRLASAEEMGRLIAILASDTAGFVTGTQLIADGGATRAI
jgi:NAD(P)-dependent dehydrogenase (short-subunit alcohol dehydrogenase family)